MMSDQGSLAELAGLPEEESGSSSVMSFPRPESPWIVNKGYQEFIGCDAYYSQILPMSPSPPRPPNHHHHHHQLPSPPVSNFSPYQQYYHYDFTISLEGHPGLPCKHGNGLLQTVKMVGEIKELGWETMERSTGEHTFWIDGTNCSSFSHFRRNSNYQGDERLFEVLQTTESVVSAPVPKALPDGAEMMIDSSEQHATITMETHSRSEGGDVGTSIRSLPATSMVNNQKKRKLPLAIFDRAKKEDLQQYSHKGIEEVARIPDASESTLKRPCVGKGISQGSELKDIILLEKAIEAEPSSNLFFTSPSTGTFGCSFGSTSSNGSSVASLLTNTEEISSFTSMELNIDEQLPSSLQTMQTSELVISAPDLLETVPEGVEVTITSSLEQNSTVETHVESKGRDVGTSVQNLAATTMAKKQKKQKITPIKGGRSKKEVTLEDLHQFSHLSLEEAARSLGVSKSTLKRRCREKGISEWSKLKDIDVSKESSEAGAYSEDVESIIIKAEYGDDIIKLKVSSSSKKADLEKEVATVLSLQDGSFRLKYQDVDDDWVIIASDFNWQDCIGASRSLGKAIIKLLIS